MRLLLTILITLSATLLGACAGTGGGLNSVAKTNRLLPGMSVADVKTLLGEPSQTQFVSEKMVWKYSLHEYWKGFVPYYLVFSSEPPALERWYADEAEYQRQQAMWMQAVSQQQQAAARDKPAAGTGKSSSNAATEACTRKYKVYEDRLCYCYNVCR